MAAFASAASSFAASTPLEKFFTCSSTADTRLASGLVLPSTTSTPATKPMARHAMKPPHDAAEIGLFVTVGVIDRTGPREHVGISALHVYRRAHSVHEIVHDDRWWEPSAHSSG